MATSAELDLSLADTAQLSHYLRNPPMDLTPGISMKHSHNNFAYLRLTTLQASPKYTFGTAG